MKAGERFGARKTSSRAACTNSPAQTPGESESGQTPTPPSTSDRLRTLGNDLLVSAALLLFWLCVRVYSLPIILIEAHSLAADFPGTDALKSAFAVGEIASIVALVVAPKAWGSKRETAMTVAAGIVGTACAALVALSLGKGSVPTLLLAASMLLAGASCALLASTACAKVFRLGASRAIVILCATFCVFETLDFTLRFFGRAQAAAVLTIPLCCICLTLSARLGRHAPDSGAPVSSGMPVLDKRARSAMGSLPWGTIVCLAILACFSTLVTSACIGERIGPLPGDPAQIACMLAVAILLTLVVCACALVPLRRSDMRSAEMMPGLAMTFVFCLSLIVIFLDRSLKILSLPTAHALMLSLWVTLVCSCSRRKVPAQSAILPTLCLVLAMLYFATSDIVFGVGLFHQIEERFSLASLLVAGALLLVMGGCVAAAVRTLRRPQNSASTSDGLDEVLARAFAGAGLSAREFEVASMLYRGHSVRRIADDLSLSPATVKTHSTHVYRKLGVHSRQELIDLVDSLRND